MFYQKQWPILFTSVVRPKWMCDQVVDLTGLGDNKRDELEK